MTEPTGQLQRQRVAVLGSLNATLRRRFSRSTMRGDLLAALVVTALMVGTLIGVCFFKGLAVGPLIAGGMVALLVGVFKL